MRERNITGDGSQNALPAASATRAKQQKLISHRARNARKPRAGLYREYCFDPKLESEPGIQ